MLDSPLRLETPLAIVDSERAEYEELFVCGDSPRWPLHFVETGRQALRDARVVRSAAWLICVELPDMSGFDLVEMLRDRIPPTPLGLVAQQYRPDEELRAYQSGATLYVCKPLDVTWLRQWLRSVCRGRSERMRTLFERGVWS